MKKLFSIVSVFVMFVSLAVAQNRTVSINVIGDRTKQVIVDGTTYTINNTTATAEQSVVIPNLTSGQHAMEIIRSSQYNNRTTSTTSSFTLRDGYDMEITVNANGTINLSETRSRTGTGTGGTAMSTGQFNRLFNATKAKTSSAARTIYLENEFNTTTRGLTSAQARQLIQLVNSESQRFKLAKMVYLRVTDKANFSQVSSLLKSTANKSALTSYIATVDSNSNVSTSTGYTPMTTERFNTIYDEVVDETTANEKLYYLSNFFDKDFNYYTSAQVRRLIQLIPSEVDRLTLVKEAYRGVTDRSTYYNEMAGLLYSTVNRNELRNYINTYDSNNGNTTTTTVAMSATSFNTLYNNIYYTNGNTARYNEINNAFVTTGNYFTAAQARQLLTLVTDESSRLALAKIAYKSLTDRSNYTVFNDLFNYQSSRNELNNYVLNFSNTTTVDPSGAMNAGEFNILYNNIYNTSGSTGRYNAINNAFLTTSNYFTAVQARQLITLVTDENSRLALAKAAYRTLTDRTNYTVLNDLFNYQSSRNELSNYVQNYGNTTTTDPAGAMSASEFNTLYNNIYNTSGTTGRYNAINNAFLTTSNSFTANQARQLITLVNDENSRLALAKAAYRTLIDRSNYTVFNDLFNYQSSRNELNNYVLNYSNTTTTNPGTAMSDGEFNMLYNNVNSSYSASSKYSLVWNSFLSTSNRFSSYQVRQLLLLINSESERLALAKAGYDNLTDQYSYTQLYDVFSSTESRNEFGRYVADIQSGGTGNSNRVAMSDADFKSIYRSVQLTFGLGAKYNSLTEIFNKQTNYFTVDQAKQLVQLVSSETNRVALTKLAWNNLTDPTNINQIYDIFTSQSSKDEIAAYVASNPY